MASRARSDQEPACSPSSRAKIDGLSKRGKHNQSIDPSRLTSAALCRSDSRAYSPIAVVLTRRSDDSCRQLP